MLFNDKSYSMKGAPWDALKKACTDLAESIFGSSGKPEDNTFELVHTIFYDERSTVSSTNRKKQYLDRILKEPIGSTTNFVTCYDRILEKVNKARDGSEFFILFLTDGKDTCNSEAKRDKKLMEMKKQLRLLSEQRGIQSTIYTMGLS